MIKSRTISVLFLVAFYCLRATAQTDLIGNNFKPGQHPRILLREGEEARILRTIAGDPIWQRTQSAILTEAKNIIALAPIQRIQIGRRLLDKSREALRRIFILGYAWRITNDQSFAKRGSEEMMAIAAFTDWNPSHFLDVAEMTMAVAIGYDWLYDYLPAASRTAIRQAIIQKGIQPSLDAKNNSWLKAEHNWNQVCNAGMAYGAMAIYEDEPVLAKQIINRALETIVIPMNDYGPDGAYPEGYGYWGYGTSFNVLFISAIETLFGKDFGLSAKPGFLQTPAYLENMTGPSGNPFNYSDAGNTGGIQPAMFWFAAKTKNPSLLWVERQRLLNTPTETLVRDRLIPGIMIWSNNINLNRISPPKDLIWVGKGKNPVALMRTSWKDSNAVFVAMKGGSVSVNHAHMDIGSFVMEANGVRWAMDFGMQQYESLESKGIQLFGRTQDAQRWTVFRYTNLVHNTLAVDSQHQRVKGYAPITNSGATPGNMFAVTDMSKVYDSMLTKAERTVSLKDKSFVVIKDVVRTTNKTSTIRWTMLTPADVTLTPNGAELVKDGKKLILRVNAPGSFRMKTWSTDPPNAYDAPNPGTILVGFETQIPADTEQVLEVTLAPRALTPKPVKRSPTISGK